jgi:chemotaxis protein MotB
MNKQLAVACLMGVVAFLGGCSDNKADQLAAAEQRNRSLNDRANKASSTLQACINERNSLGQQLLAARNEIESLRAQVANAPTPEPAPTGWTAVPGGGMIAIEDNLLFAAGKVTLRDDARKTLDGIVTTLKKEYGDKDIVVFGHTDDRPIKKSGWDDNWQLSSERSLAVTRYLQEHGIESHRLVSAGCGENRPRAVNDSDQNRTRNRRVEIFAIDPQALTGRSSPSDSKRS